MKRMLIVLMGLAISGVIPGLVGAMESKETLKRTVHLKPGESAAFSDTSRFACYTSDPHYVCSFSVHEIAGIGNVAFAWDPRAEVSEAADAHWIAAYTIWVPESVPPGHHIVTVAYWWGRDRISVGELWNCGTMIEIDLVVEAPTGVTQITWGKLKTMSP